MYATKQPQIKWQNTEFFRRHNQYEQLSAHIFFDRCFGVQAVVS